MKLIDNLTMGRKLALLSGTMIALTVLAIYVGATLLQESNDWANIKGSTNQLSSLFFEQSTNLRGYIISGDQSFLNELDTNAKLFQKTVQEAKSFTKDQGIQDALAKFQADEQRWHEQVANPVIELRKKVNAGQATLQELNQKFLTVHYGNFLLAEFSIRKDSQDLVALSIQKTEAATAQARIILITILGTEIMVGTTLSVGVSRSVIKPVRKLQDAAKMLQKLQDVAGFDFAAKPSKWEAVVNVVSRIRKETFGHHDEETVLADIPTQEKLHTLKFEHDDAAKAFRFVAREFLQDYTFQRLSIDASGWRTALEIADGADIPTSKVYGRNGDPGSALVELLKRGLVESRWFPGHRGRGGTIMKIRVNNGNPYVKGELERLALQP
jgi:CHASE3 domain sensor protein